MRKTKEINVEIVRMVGDVAPFVQVAYMDKEAQEQTGLMLLDTGSTVNILSPEMADRIGILCKQKGKGTSISSISGNSIDADYVNFSFALEGKQFHETFCITNKRLPICVKGAKVLGLLGNQFLLKHRLVLDYCNHTLHTSEVCPENLAISDCSFFFPMNIGLKFYGLPVLSVKQNGKELVTLIDTGATDNMIARQALHENGFRCRYLERKDIITNITGEVDVDEAIVWFKMMSLDSNDLFPIRRHDHFAVLPQNILNPEKDECDTNGEQLPPIEVLLGAPFMAKEGWTLDFGARIIYKRKVA